MKRNRKAFIILVVIVVSVLLVGVVTTTYAWFLSRYNSDLEFELRSTSPLVLKYETDLDFASGNISTAGNVLIPATEKRVDSSGDPIPGIAQAALSPLDVFDVDTESPAHTGKVQSAAQAVKYTATGAYYTGEEDELGGFVPRLYAFTGDFLASAELSTHLASMTEQGEAPLTITEDTLLSVLTREETKKAAANRLIARNDLVGQGEIDYILIIEYLEKTFLYYDGAYYVSGSSTGSDFTLPTEVDPDETELRYWHDPTAENSTANGNQISDGSYFRLQPNTTFSLTLYVFVAKTDERLDPAINGERLTLFMSMQATEVNEVPPAVSEEP